MNTISQHLNDHRQKSGLRLKDLAERTGLSVSYLSDLERGRTQPPLKTLERIATAYGKSINDFIGGMDLRFTPRELLLIDAYRSGDLATVVRYALEKHYEVSFG